MNRDTPLLARYAESLFWMARYLERVENLARLVDVTQTFESPGREAESWFALVRINADENGFAKRGLAHSADAVKHFYLLDGGNPTSIPASLEAARTNARTLRPLISTEMWMQLNVFHRDMLAITPADLEGDQLSRLCRVIKEGVQTHTGITEGTFFRDQGWFFYQLGRLIERADQTTRLLDIRYHILVPVVASEERRVTELTQWGAVLRAAAGYHAFRRVAPAGFTPEDVVAFLLADTAFPRRRGAVHRADGVAAGPVAQPLRAARHRRGAGAGGGTARGGDGPAGRAHPGGRAASVSGRHPARPDPAGGRDRHRVFPRLAAAGRGAVADADAGGVGAFIIPTSCRNGRAKAPAWIRPVLAGA
jgi:uncharacterized alpha-E superfamily protein